MSKYGTVKYNLEKAKEKIDFALSKIDKIRNDVGVIMPVEIISVNPDRSLSRYYHIKNPYSYNSYDSKSRNHVESAYKVTIEKYEELKKKVEEIHNKNEKALKNNEETAQKVRDFMNTVGIPNSFSTYDYPSKRHKTKKRINHEAGYIQDIRRCIKQSDGYESSIRILEDFKESIQKQYDNLIAEISKAERNAQAEQKKKDNIQKLARFQVKYETEGDWEDILNIIIDKNKYLCLAHFLLENRNDWNDGYSYAERGLMNFSVETDEDQSIYDEINSLIGDNWDGDGRCFRDCEWSYDQLFSMVDEKLMNDYNEVAKEVTGF